MSFFNCSEPVHPETWWQDSDLRRVCGHMRVLEALEASLRELGSNPAEAPAPVLTRASSRSEEILALAQTLMPAIEQFLDGIKAIKALAAGVTLNSFPPQLTLKIIRAIMGATGISASEAKRLTENLPASMRALVPNSALAEALESLGASVEVQSWAS